MHGMNECDKIVANSRTHSMVAAHYASQVVLSDVVPELLENLLLVSLTPGVQCDFICSVSPV